MRHFHHKASVERDLKKPGKPQAERVPDKVERDLALHPEKGEASRCAFRGLNQCRIGDYRVIHTEIVDGILVPRIAHGRESYEETSGYHSGDCDAR